MIYLIGISDHNVQHNGIGCADSVVRNNFSVFLEKKIRRYSINLIAEEFNEDALYKVSKGNIATIRNLVEKLKSEGLEIKHVFCEPSLSERKAEDILSASEIYSKKLNIHIYNGKKPNLNKEQQKIFDEEMKRSFLAREQIWLKKIHSYLDNNVLFICGSDHITSFESLLMSKGCKTKVLESRLGSQNSSF
jgi:Asp-tRNA(Asn)/Glu-tRNA(Gln) amidotransferase A subunit family amidase